MLTEHMTGLLEQRGITAEIALKLGWTVSVRDDAEYLAIPYYRSGVVVGTKYRTLSGDKKFFQDKGSEQCFYNLDAIKDIGTSPLVIVEGEMDCAIALQCGWLAVSVPNGAPAKTVESDGSKYDYLKDIPDNCEIILAVDGDAQGANLLHDLSLRLNPARCKWVKYPVGCKDLNDAFVKYQQRGVDETLRRARWCDVDGIYRMSDLPPPPKAVPIPCPIDGMGDHYKIRLGDFTVISGLPSFGKTTWTNELACAMAMTHGWNIAVASFEQNPKQDHLRSLRTFHAGRPADLLDNAELAAADAWIDERFTFMVPRLDDDVTLKWVLDKCKAAILRNGAKLIIIDPWNEMDHEYPSGMTLTQYTGFAIKQFKKLAQKYMVHVIVVAHPAKMMRDKTSGTYPMPSLYDISDSAHWANKADIGIIVHRENDLTRVKVAKVRYFKLIGLPGEVTLSYDDYCNRFRHVPEDEVPTENAPAPQRWTKPSTATYGKRH